MATDNNMDFPSLDCRKTEGASQDPSEPTTVPMAPRDLQPDPVPDCACPVGKQDGKLAWLFPASLAAQGSNICYCCPLTPYPSSTSLNCVFCNHFTVREKLRPKAQWLDRKGFGPGIWTGSDLGLGLVLLPFSSHLLPPEAWECVEMAEWVKCSPHSHKNLSLDLQTL